MPAVVAQVVSYGIGAAFGVSTTAGSVAAAVGSIVGYATTTGAAIAYNSSQQRKVRKALQQSASAIDQSRKVMSRDPVAPRRVIYGQVPVSGPIVYMAVTGTENEYLHMVIVLASHECEELGEIKLNDTVLTLSGENATGDYAGYVRVKKFLGIAAGERDLDLETESGGEWTSSHLGKGVARLHVRLKHSPDLFPEGLPLITCMVKGKKVYDPRTETTAWSANAALCTADYLSDEKFGKGVPYSRINIPALIEAANICDEEIGLAT